MTDWHIIGVIIGGAVIAITLISIYNIKKYSGIDPAEQMRTDEDSRLNDEGEITTFYAEVLDMTCGVTMVGHQEPKALKYFVIKLKRDDGEIINLPVSEEVYEGFDIGLYGMLTLIDGKLDSFELDENFIAEELDSNDAMTE